MREYNGVLGSHNEHGSEGVRWILVEDGKTGYDAEVFIDAGDRLVIYNADGNVLFDGIIALDKETGYMPYRLNPEDGQPFALGWPIHWTQMGWQPDDWAKLFIREPNEPKLRAKLIKP